MACGSGVDDRGGVCRWGGGRMCGCNDTSSNGYIISSRHMSDRPLYQEPWEVWEDPVRGLGTKLVVMPLVVLVAVAATWRPSPG
jgi:hypothetical protein